MPWLDSSLSVDIMATFQSLCLISVFIAGCQAQHSVTQDPAVITTSPGQNVRLSCELGGGLTVSGNCVRFFQQKEGKTPTFIMQYCSDSNKVRGEGVPPRFVVSGSGNRGYMDITGVQAEDEAVYQCATWTGSQFIFGPGTPLSVLTGEAKSPLMSIYPPSEEELKTGKSSTVCLGMDYTPGSATIQWTVDGATQTTGVSPLSISRQSNDLYSASSVLSMSSSDYEKYKQIACTMTHQGKSFVQILKTSECN